MRVLEYARETGVLSRRGGANREALPETLKIPDEIARREARPSKLEEARRVIEARTGSGLPRGFGISRRGRGSAPRGGLAARSRHLPLAPKPDRLLELEVARGVAVGDVLHQTPGQRQIVRQFAALDLPA